MYAVSVTYSKSANINLHEHTTIKRIGLIQVDDKLETNWQNPQLVSSRVCGCVTDGTPSAFRRKGLSLTALNHIANTHKTKDYDKNLYTLIVPILYVLLDSLYTIVTKSLPICNFLEWQLGSFSLFGINVAM